MRTGYPPFHAHLWGSRDPKNSLGVGVISAGESPVHYQRRHVRGVSEQDRKPLSGQRSSLKQRQLLSCLNTSTRVPLGKKNKKDCRKQQGKEYWVDGFHFPRCLRHQSNMLEPLICYRVADCTAINPPVPTHKPAKARRRL